MSRYYGGWAPYVPVAERRREAEREMARLRKSGHKVTPVVISGRSIASTVWGRAWCDHIESLRDYENRLPRGRTYVRNGSVVDLQITPGRIAAIVSGSELYSVAITITQAAQARWRAICADCAGGIDSLVELLQGKLSRSVMERLCRADGGLLPRPSEIRFTCSCPDSAGMCKHIAAVLYGVGARLDQQPELLFRLRAVDPADLLTRIDVALPLGAAPGVGRMLAEDDMSALFGIDMADAADPAGAAPPAEATAAPVTAPRRAPGKAAARQRAKPAAPDAAHGRATATPPASKARKLAPPPAPRAKSAVPPTASVPAKAAKPAVRPRSAATPPASRKTAAAAMPPARRSAALRVASRPETVAAREPIQPAPPAAGRKKASTPVKPPRAAAPKPVKWW